LTLTLAALQSTIFVSSLHTSSTSIGSTLQFTTNGGVAVLNDLRVDYVSSNVVLKASTDGLTAAQSSAFSVVVGTCASLKFTQIPTLEALGVAFSVDVLVTCVDMAGLTNTATTNVTVTLAICPGTTNAGMTTTVLSQIGGNANSGNAIVANIVQGIATFQGLMVNTIAKSLALSAWTNSVGISPATSSTFRVLTTDQKAYYVQTGLLPEQKSSNPITEYLTPKNLLYGGIALGVLFLIILLICCICHKRYSSDKVEPVVPVPVKTTVIYITTEDPNAKSNNFNANDNFMSNNISVVPSESNNDVMAFDAAQTANYFDPVQKPNRPQDAAFKRRESMSYAARNSGDDESRQSMKNLSSTSVKKMNTMRGAKGISK
jgi:hypothetical protein